MRTSREVALVLLALIALGAAPAKDDGVRQCERVASRAACDPATGYIAGAAGPCQSSDLRCIEAEWIRRGRVVYYPDLGLCGRNHEDGGTIVTCPPGLGSNAGGPPGASAQPPGTNGRPRRTTAGNPRNPNQPPPPPPPTLDEALAQCSGLPSPVLRRNPDQEGVTGMETWLWADPQDVVRRTGTVRGYAVSCTATPEAWTWRTGDGPSFTRSGPGSAPPNQAVTYTYRRKGTYTQELSLRWRVETSAGNGSATTQTSRAYRVVEVRGALDR